MAGKRPLIIAHRGASGYLPEHTLEAKAMAYAQGADYLEQDIVASRDDELVVLHDIHLDTVTDVADRFSDRHRDDGRFYVRDFDLDELKQLNVHERRRPGGESAALPNRFPTEKGTFGIATLREEIELIQGLNQSTGGDCGIYPEIKSPVWHKRQGVDLSVLLLDILDEYGYSRRDDPVFVQCFALAEIHRIRHELGSDLRLVQLLADNDSYWGDPETDYDVLKTPAGLAELAKTAQGIGPWIPQLASTAEIDGQPLSTGLVRAAHDADLVVHPYTFRADGLALGFESFEQMIQWFANELGIDGLFTDFPDLTLAALQN